MNQTLLFLLGMVVSLGCDSRKNQPSETPVDLKPELITHSIFIAGPDFTGILDESGAIAWDAGQPAARDGFVLPNGNVLICWSDKVVEYGQQKEVVFEYNLAAINQELGTAVRLENGHTLISELGSKPRLIEVDMAGIIQVEVPLKPETDNAHMQTRMARKLINGNYLVPHLLAFAVKEYSPEGEVLQTFKTDLPELGGVEAENWPFTAIRLENGNSLISLTHGNKIIEIDGSGKIIWKMGNEDVEGDLFQDPCGAQRLPNGNTVIASYGAKEGVKVFETSPDKEIVWSYSGEFGVHHFQILTTNGRPITGKPLK
jgi:hypothetical protein